MADRPLAGILVVSLEQAVAAPLCSSRLADAGARVIKVERAEGDFARRYDTVVNGDSSYFVWLNRGKQSLILDIKKDDDIALLERILSRADIYIQNLAPGAAERAGLGSAAMRAANPRLVTCDISGYGAGGPYRDMKAYDLLVQAESGLCAVTGTPEAPGRVGVSVCDIAAGLNAYAGILEALYARERTGEGSAIEVSLFDGMADWMNVPYLHHAYGGRAPARVGLSHPSIAPYAAYAAKDGKEVLISIQNEREWADLCAKVLERPALAADPRFADPDSRVRNRAALDAIIAAAFAQWPRDALMARLRAVRIACGALNEVADLARHAQLRTARCAAPSGPVELIAPPVIRDGAAPALGPVPRVGEHDAAIRQEFAA
jgi:itaconate CoA-transferase